MSEVQPALPDDTFYRLVGQYANHEAKLLIGVVYGAQTEQTLIARQAQRQLRDHAGAQLDSGIWVPDPMTVMHYCELSLEPSGVLASTPSANRYQTGFRATELGQGRGMALAGSVLSWVADNPDLSLQKIFQQGKSVPGEPFPGETAYKILRFLTDQPEPKSEKEISEGIDYEPSLTVLRQIVRGTRLGLYTKESKKDNYNPAVVIEEPTTNTAQRRLEETTLIREAIREMYAEGMRETDFDSVLERALEASDQRHDPVKVRAVLTMAMAKPNRIPEIKPKHPDQIKRARTAISLSPQAKAPVSDLVDRLEKFRTEPIDTEMVDRASEILADAKMLEKILNIAATASTKVRRSREDADARLNDAIISYVGANDGSGASEIVTGVLDGGQNVSAQTVQKFITGLVSSGRLKAKSLRPDQTMKGKTRTYFLPED